MSPLLPPLLIFAVASTSVGLGMWLAGSLLGPRRAGRVKEMPYESGMDPIHDARRRFDVRFHLVAVAFLLFDVELLFLYPWSVAQKHPEGLAAIAKGSAEPAVFQAVVFGEIMLFLALLTLGLVYAWRRGVFNWR